MKRLALFAHFDRDDRVRPHIVHHLQALKALGATVHFISNSHLPESELSKIREWVDDIQLRENTGLDFGMWKEGLARVQLAEWEEVVLTNSSVIGPIYPLEPIFERMAQAPCDFWAMTESWMCLHHFQSYFLVAKKRVLQSAAFKTFFESVLPYTDKKNIIYSYELGLLAHLTQHGLQGSAAFPIADLKVSLLCRLLLAVRDGIRIPPRRRKKGSLNPTIDQAQHLFEGGMPYIKIEILRNNPRGIWHAQLRRKIRQNPLACALSQDL